MAKPVKTEKKTHAERQADYHKKMRESGMARVSVWIRDTPEARADMADRVKRLNKKHG